jgi:hypothetical protein
METLQRNRQQNMIARVSVKHARNKQSNPLLVWIPTTNYEAYERETFSEIALQQGKHESKPIDFDYLKRTIISGNSVLCGGTIQHPKIEEISDWTLTSTWKQFIAPIKMSKCAKYVDVNAKGNVIKCNVIGTGTFNVVFKCSAKHTFLSSDTSIAFRVTRPDMSDEENKYQRFETCVTEVYNALLCSINCIGVPILGTCVFESPPIECSLRFGVAMAMSCATNDLFKHMTLLTTTQDGFETAEAVTKLLFKASRMGILFIDIKPANILLIKSDSITEEFRLTDYDPAFFIITNKDWKSLLLFNTAMLSAHVFNGNFGAPGFGWGKAVGPLLLQLVTYPDRYDSKWLFEARAAKLKFQERKNNTDFQIQKLFVSIWTSYFYSPEKPVLSMQYNWKNVSNNTKDLLEHWKLLYNHESWPPQWRSNDSHPLIVQIVDFCLSV